MDFLDPRARRAHRTRLMVGYGLTALAVALGTVILVYDAYGYGVNTRGDIISNGLLFVDSKPGGAKIYLDGEYQNSDTSSRIILPAQSYLLTLKKDSYRDWNRRFLLSEHSISRYVYPLLIPKELKPEAVKKYEASPGLVTQPPDQRFLLVQTNRPASGAFVFDEFDSSDSAKAPVARTLPPSLLTGATAGGDKLVEIEWSTDNRHVLLRHDYNGGSEFLIFDRQDPAASINLNRLLDVTPSAVSLRNKKADQVYIYNQDGGTLQVGDTNDGQLAPPFLQNILAYKPHGSTLLTYVTAEGAPEGQVVSRIWDNGQSYTLNQFPAGSTYLVEAAQFQGHWYYLAGSDTTERIGIYKDPLNSLKNPALKKAMPMVALRLSGGQKLSFSANTRFIALQAGAKFAVYDLEVKDLFSYSLPTPPAGNMSWMDGHRLIGLSDGKVTLFDFDGTNRQVLIPSSLPTGAFFDRNFEKLFSIPPADGNGAADLQATNLLAGSDLPE